MTVFLGGSPKSISSLYSLLGYADIDLGIWYPIGGFGQVVAGFEKLAKENGVKIVKNQPVRHIATKDGRVTGIVTQAGKLIEADIIVSNADYQHTEQNLLNKTDRMYSRDYWQKLQTSPSSILYFIGLNKKVKGMLHHTLFFDSDWDEHFASIDKKSIITNPLFYVSAPSVSDESIAPKGTENIFVLVPVPSGVRPTKKEKQLIFANIIRRMEKKYNSNLNSSITFYREEDSKYFEEEFNSYRGSSFGASHTTRQSSLLRPRLKSKKIKGLYYVGQYTNPGTGVPLVISSAELINDYIKEDYGSAN
jgi:phytoene desaturase